MPDEAPSLTSTALPTQGFAPRQPVVLGTPSAELSDGQRLDALRRVQAQAENRVKLGMQLFKSAEARLTAQADLARSLRAEQADLSTRVDDRLDAVAAEIGKLRSEADTPLPPTLLERLDRLEHAVDTVVEAERAIRDDQARAMEAMRRDHAELQQQTRQSLEHLTRLVESALPARHFANPPASTTADTSTHIPHAITPSPGSTQAHPSSQSTKPDATPPSPDPPQQTTSPAIDQDDARIYSSILDRLRHTQKHDVPDTDLASPHG